MNETKPSLLQQADSFGDRVSDFFNGIFLNFLLLLFGPALILIGVHSLPPQWRPGLHWPIHGETAPAKIESLHLALRHVQQDPTIHNVQASVTVALAYTDRAGKPQRAFLTGPWLLQMSTQWTGDAAWFYLDDIGSGFGAGPLDIDMPRDVASQLAVPHAEFGINEKTAANLDRPLRWVAFDWLAPEHPLIVRYDPLHPEIAIPEFLVERESTRLQGVGVLRVLGFVLGCILVAAFAWRTLAFSNRFLRMGTTLLVVATVLQWSPYASSLIRWFVPGIDIWSGLNIDEVVADPIGMFYDEFKAGPGYVVAKTVQPAQGVHWTADKLSAHALTQWLRSIPVVPEGGGLDDAEAALAQAARLALPALDNANLHAIYEELQEPALRKYWTGAKHYVELRDAARAELERRGQSSL